MSFFLFKSEKESDILILIDEDSVQEAKAAIIEKLLAFEVVKHEANDLKLINIVAYNTLSHIMAYHNDVKKFLIISPKYHTLGYNTSLFIKP